MINSVKLIINIRGITQNQLKVATFGARQNVSRWIARGHKIPEDLRPYWENILGVDQSWFVDEDGYCRLLDEKEAYELEEVILTQAFDCPDIDYQANVQKQRIERIHHDMVAKEKLLAAIEEDIFEMQYNADEMLPEEQLDILEENMSIYEKILEIRKTKSISRIEWFYVLRALSELSSNSDIGTKKENDTIDGQICAILKKAREHDKQKALEIIQLLNIDVTSNKQND